MQRPNHERLACDPSAPATFGLVIKYKEIIIIIIIPIKIQQNRERDRESRERRDGHELTSVNIPDADATVDVTRGKDELFIAEIETGPVLALRRVGQLTLGCSATKSGRIDGRAGIDANHLPFDFVAFIVRVVQR